MRYFIFSLLAFQCFVLKAQNTEGYEVRDGKIDISVNYHDSILNFDSRNLKVFIDNNTMRINISLSPSSLSCGVDSIDMQLQQSELEDLVFVGKIGLQRFWIQNKAPQHFEIEGKLTINGISKDIALQGSLFDYRQGPKMEALMSIQFELNVDDFDLRSKLNLSTPLIAIDIVQTIVIPADRD